MTCRSGRRVYFSRNPGHIRGWRQCCNLEIPEAENGDFFNHGDSPLESEAGQVPQLTLHKRNLTRSGPRNPDQPKPWGPVRQPWVRRGPLRYRPRQGGLRASPLVPCTPCTWDMFNLIHNLNTAVKSFFFVKILVTEGCWYPEMEKAIKIAQIQKRPNNMSTNKFATKQRKWPIKLWTICK